MDAAYNVMIKLAAENAVSGALAVISKDVLGLHGNVKDLEKGFATWAPAIAGAAAAIAGIKLGEMVAGVVEAGSKLEHFKAQMLAATGDIGKVADATNLAWQETTRNLNSSVAENVKNIQHLMNVTGSFDEAKRMLHPFTMADTALASLKDDEMRSKFTGPGAEMNTYNLARSLEQLGVTQDDEKINSYLNGMTRAMVAERGLVDGSKFFNAIQNAGAPRADWNEDFVEKGLAPLIQATNGRIGAQLYQLDRSFGQGVSTRMMAQGAEKYGLWNEGDEVWEAGKFKGMKVGSAFEDDVRRKNPIQWAGDVREMLRQRGVNVDDTDTMMGVVDEITRGNKNLGAGMSELIMPNAYSSLMKERRNIEAVPADAVGILQQKDPSLAVKEFHTQWDNLMQALGSPMVETATNVLHSVSEVINTIAREAAAHPDAVRATGVVLLGVAAGLTALGVVLTGTAIAAAFGATAVVGGAVAGIVAGLTAIGAGIVLFADKIKAVGHFFGIGGDDVSGIMGHPDHPHTATPLTGRAGQQLLEGLGMLPTGPGGMFGKISYGVASNDNGPLVDAIASGFLKAFREIQGGGAGPDATGAAGGVISAAYTTYGSGGGGRRFGGGSGVGGGSVDVGGSSAGNLTRLITEAASNAGIDPRIMEGIRAGESGHGSGYDKKDDAIESSWGPFQLNRRRGLGVQFEKDTGLDVRDPRTIAAQARWVANYIKHGGSLGAWMGYHGLRDADPRWGDSGYVPAPSSSTVKAIPAPPRRPPADHPPIMVQMDGKLVAHLVSKRQGVAGRFPTSVGSVDEHGHYSNPGTPLDDVA